MNIMCLGARAQRRPAELSMPGLPQYSGEFGSLAMYLASAAAARWKLSALIPVLISSTLLSAMYESIITMVASITASNSERPVASAMNLSAWPCVSGVGMALGLPLAMAARARIAGS